MRYFALQVVELVLRDRCVHRFKAAGAHSCIVNDCQCPSPAGIHNRLRAATHITPTDVTAIRKALLEWLRTVYRDRSAVEAPCTLLLGQDSSSVTIGGANASRVQLRFV